jgi:hypothetical protein
MPTIISPTNSRIAFATKSNVLADNSAVVAIKVTIRDADGAPIFGVPVEIVTEALGVQIAQPSPTDNNGVTFGYAKSRVAGVATFQARALPLNDETRATVIEQGADPQAGALGAVWIENKISANFYAPEIEPAPQLQTTARNIHLTWSVSRYIENNVDGVRVRIVADSADLMPTKIFAYQLLPVKPGAEEPIGMFDHVCSPVDLEEFPEDAPLLNSRPQWFRLDYVDVLLRSREETREFINAVVEDVKILKDTLDITEDLVPDGDLWIGTPPAE